MGEITLASTTQSVEEMQQALGVVPEPEVVEQTEEIELTPGSPEKGEETAADSEPAPTEKKDKKGAHRDKQIDRLTRQKYEALEEADRLREQLRQLQEQSTKPAPQAQGKPERKDFASDELWVEAIAEYKAQDLYEKRRNAELEAERTERDKELFISYGQKADEFAAEHEDFNDVVGTIKLSAEIAPAIEVAIRGRKNGPEVVYFLGQHPEICDELSQMNAADAVAEIGALSAQLLSPKPSPKPAAKPPAPIKTLAGTSRAGDDSYRDDMTQAEYKAWYRKNYGR